MENTKDLSKISLAELLNALQAQEQRRLMREDATTEGALAAKQHVAKNKKNKNQKKAYPPCQHCEKKGHPPFKCWRRPDAECTICNQKGHEAIICKNKNQQQGEVAKTADQEEEDHLFVATCFSGIESSESWLIDSGCTNHMTYDKNLFRELSSTTSSKVELEMEST